MVKITFGGNKSMSVPTSRRSLSNRQYEHLAHEILIDLNSWILRDFGLKPRITEYSAVDDTTNLEAALGLETTESPDATEDNEHVRVLKKYPSFIIEFYSKEALKHVNNLLMNITAADSIFPINKREVEQKRLYCNLTIVDCQQLLRTLQSLTETIPEISLDTLRPVLDKISKEINHLKSWRKKCNIILKNINEGKSWNAPIKHMHDNNAPSSLKSNITTNSISVNSQGQTSTNNINTEPQVHRIVRRVVPQES